MYDLLTQGILTLVIILITLFIIIVIIIVYITNPLDKDGNVHHRMKFTADLFKESELDNEDEQNTPNDVQNRK